MEGSEDSLRPSDTKLTKLPTYQKQSIKANKVNRKIINLFFYQPKIWMNIGTLFVFPWFAKFVRIPNN
jgi:hypothetical protein